MVRDVSEPGDEQGLRDIAEFLSIPSRSGVFLSNVDLERIGMSIGVRGLPRSRKMAVEQLFRAAGMDDRLEDLLDALAIEIQAHRRAYQEFDDSRMAGWDARTARTLEWLDGLRQVLGD